MPVPFHRLLVVAPIVAGLAGLSWYAAVAHSRPGPGPGELFARSGNSDGCNPVDDELERQRRIALGRMTAKDEVVRQLLTGRLTLAQAAARFRAAELGFPTKSGPARTDGGPGEDERLCRDVIRRVYYWVAARLPTESGPIAARLAAELETLRGPDGTVRLPD